jgi:hypothetical protein
MRRYGYGQEWINARHLSAALDNCAPVDQQLASVASAQHLFVIVRI